MAWLIYGAMSNREFDDERADRTPDFLIERRGLHPCTAYR